MNLPFFKKPANVIFLLSFLICVVLVNIHGFREEDTGTNANKPQPTAVPTATPEKKWRQVVKISGTGASDSEISDSFTLSHIPWRIRWVTGYLNLLTIYVRDSESDELVTIGGRYIDSEWIEDIPPPVRLGLNKVAVGEHVVGIPGSFYIRATASDVWLVTIESYY